MRTLPIVAAIVFVLWLLFKGKGSQSATAPSQADSSGGNSRMEDFTHAISTLEKSGFGRNNPGNLKSGGYTGQVGTDANGFAVFGDVGDGWDALNGYVNRRTTAHPEWDFYDFFNYYLTGSTTSPAQTSQGNSDAYAEYVAGYLGVDPTQPVSAAIGA